MIIKTAANLAKRSEDTAVLLKAHPIGSLSRRTILWTDDDGRAVGYLRRRMAGGRISSCPILPSRMFEKNPSPLFPHFRTEDPCPNTAEVADLQACMNSEGSIFFMAFPVGVPSIQLPGVAAPIQLLVDANPQDSDEVGIISLSPINKEVQIYASLTGTPIPAKPAAGEGDRMTWEECFGRGRNPVVACCWVSYFTRNDNTICGRAFPSRACYG